MGLRTNKRGPALLPRLRDAVEATIGDLLLNYLQTDAGWSYRPQDAKSFTGHRVPHRQFKSVMEVICKLEWVETTKAYQQFSGFGVAASFSVRLRPTETLLSLVAGHGIDSSELRSHFEQIAEVRPADLIQLKTRSSRSGHVKSSGKRIKYDDTPETIQMRAQVEAMNEFAKQHVVTGCTPPQWKRVFTGSFEAGGRWYSLGNRSYQQLPKEERQAITINGEPVVEIDVKASHLTCLYGMCGLDLNLRTDPYHVPGLPRVVVKCWITGTLGNGKPLKRWPQQAKETALEQGVDLRQYKVSTVQALVVKRHPILGKIEEWGFDSLYIAVEEAYAFTRAMLELKQSDILALPVHDSLIVAASHKDEAIEAINSAFYANFKLKPSLDIKSSSNKDHHLLH